MDFFAQQDRTRRKTKLLVFYFILAVAAIVVACYFVGLVISSAAQSHHHHYEESPQLVLWNPQLFLGVTAGVLAVIVIGSAYKTNELAGGGGSVATLMGGRLVNSNTTDPDERKLLNVVEEMAIASGVPVPQVYVLDEEHAINAFAAGHTTSDAAIGVTRGCIQMLSRDQLQGVIGHEYSHILNGDMRLNLRLIGIIFGILCIATLGRVLCRVRGRNSGGVVFVGLLLLAIGAIGAFFGRLIQAAVSRQREFLADASSVQFTRNPGGLSGALQKIGRYSYGSKLESEHAPDLCHMFFGNGLDEPFFGLLATHPPIPDRIHAIDPTWDGKFPPLDEKQIEVVKRAAISELEHTPKPLPDLFKTVLGGAIIAGGSAEKPPVIRSRSVMPNLGNPKPLHLKYAEQLRDSLPDSVKAAAREPLDAVALIYAMLLSPDSALRDAQFTGLAQRVEPAIQEKTIALFPDVSSAATHARLPIVNLALGALRQMTTEQFNQFSPTLQWLIESDGKIELFEFVVQKIVLRHLTLQFSGARPPVAQYYTLKPLVPDCAVVLSALANVGSSDAAEIEKAFETGAPYLRAPNDGDLTLLPREQCGVDQIDAALNRLVLAVPTIKKNLIEACVYTVGADGVMTESEAELLRAVADTLDCPMPPFVQTER
ncbi:MAG: M48 family metallopeptidase [Verrucomicrobiota bacterium]|jgi:Zn-dependent protease with chaperone function